MPLCNLKSFEKIEFTYDDIVRSDLVKEYIIAKNKFLELGYINDIDSEEKLRQTKVTFYAEAK